MGYVSNVKIKQSYYDRALDSRPLILKGAIESVVDINLGIFVDFLLFRIELKRYFGIRKGYVDFRIANVRLQDSEYVLSRFLNLRKGIV
jgi:hypothetical protein